MLRTEYDEQGRLVGTIDAAGHRVQVVHDPDQHIETVVDHFGNQTIFEYDGRGNVVGETDATVAVTRRGTTRTTTWSQRPMRSERRQVTLTMARASCSSLTDHLGYSTRYTYGPAGALKTRTDPLGNTTTNLLDPRGNVVQIVDAAGNRSVFDHDGAGNVTRMTDCWAESPASGTTASATSLAKSMLWPPSVRSLTTLMETGSPRRFP